MASTYSLVGLLPVFLSLISPSSSAAVAPSCRSFPGDSSWPTANDWSAFNKTVGGRLVATVPIAAACHDDAFTPYNQAECARVQNNWGFPELHYTSSSSVMAPYFANRSCDAFADRSAQCIDGTYVRYAVKASCADDYKKTIKFAQSKNIRLVVRNTGHDFFGKSTGAGALAVWTHYMKGITIKDYKSDKYTGKAIKIGAGVQSFEALEAAGKAGYVTVSGNCPTVGLAGGYSQAGGHSPLSSKYGLAADQVLEWEVVTGNGDLVTATPTNAYKDLYFALSGGGGSTYGVVVSMTARIYKDISVTSANLTFASTGSADDFYSAVQTYMLSLNSIADAGAVSVWVLTNTTFSVIPTTGPGVSKTKMDSLFAPTLAALKKLNIPYTYYSQTFPTYLTANAAMNPQGNNTEISLGGRLLPRTLVANKAASDKFMAAARFIVGRDPRVILEGITLNVNTAAQSSARNANAAHPAWRTAILNAVIGVAWDRDDWASNLQGQQLITNELQPKLDALTPGGGSYMNEADFHQKDWKQTFFGSNYNTLLATKNKYDPSHTFYARTAVGSDYWVEEANGKLCKA